MAGTRRRLAALKIFGCFLRDLPLGRASSRTFLWVVIFFLPLAIQQLLGVLVVLRVYLGLPACQVPDVLARGGADQREGVPPHHVRAHQALRWFLDDRVLVKCHRCSCFTVPACGDSASSGFEPRCLPVTLRLTGRSRSCPERPRASRHNRRTAPSSR